VAGRDVQNPYKAFAKNENWMHAKFARDPSDRLFETNIALPQTWRSGWFKPLDASAM
jgi:hypothetical protein